MHGTRLRLDLYRKHPCWDEHLAWLNELRLHHELPTQTREHLVVHGRVYVGCHQLQEPATAGSCHRQHSFLDSTTDRELAVNTVDVAQIVRKSHAARLAHRLDAELNAATAAGGAVRQSLGTFAERAIVHEPDGQGQGTQ